MTSYPFFKERLSLYYNYQEEKVVCDEKLITSQGPGTSFEFALKIVEKILRSFLNQLLLRKSTFILHCSFAQLVNDNGILSFTHK